MLSKLKCQLEEMKLKVQFLELVKKCLQVTYAEQWGLEISALPTVASITTQSDMLTLSPSDESSLLIFLNVKEEQSDNHSRSRILQAGTPLGLMAYLYSSNAVFEGYVQQFLYTFRYFCTQEEFLQFLLDRANCTISSENLDPSSVLTKIYNRTLYILQAWIEDCCNIDFTPNTNLWDKLEDYISLKMNPKDIQGEQLLSLLQDLTSRQSSSLSPGSSLGERRDDDETKSLHSFCNKLSEDNISRKSFNWKILKGNGPVMLHQKEKQYTISSALPRPCYASYIEEFSGTYVKGDERGPYFFSDYTVQQFSHQLTLLQEERFKKCHPVNFLNSRALGVGDKPSAIPKSFCTESPWLDGCSLFLPNCIQNKYLVHLLRFAENVSTWVAAEIVTSHTPKLQVNLLSTFLLIAKCCYEQRDFATAMQILGGLENLIVRQLPAWKNLPSKVSEILEDLKAVEVFLKSDNLCLMEGDRFKTLPTIPSAHILAMHVQQLETGGFTMTNGAYKWSKLRNIAKVVSQVHAFQEIPYALAPDPELQFYLKQRIAYFGEADLSVLAANNNANFHHISADKHSRKINDTLRKMKATFQ